MISLKQVFKNRLMFMEYYVKSGVIPGKLESVELEQMKGRIEELKFVIEFVTKFTELPNYLNINQSHLPTVEGVE